VVAHKYLRADCMGLNNDSKILYTENYCATKKMQKLGQNILKTKK